MSLTGFLFSLNSKNTSSTSNVDLNSIFDVEFIPDNASRTTNVLDKVSSGDQLRTWVSTDQTTSVYNSPYMDSATEPITRYGGIPRYYKRSDEYSGYLFLPNVNNARWESNNFNPQSQPYTEYWVIRDLEGLDGENWWKGETNLRDATDNFNNKIRIGLTQSENIQITENFRLTPNAYNIIKVVYNGSSTQLYVNGNKIGDDITINTSNQIDRINFGSQTNASHSLQYYRGIKFGLLTLEEDTIIYNELNRRFPANELVKAPFASNIQMNQSNDGTVTITSTENLYQSSPIVRREYRLYEAGNASSRDLSNQNFVASWIDNDSFNLNDYPSIFGIANPSFVWYKVSVKLTDANGNTWMHTDPRDWERDSQNRAPFVGINTQRRILLSMRQSSDVAANWGSEFGNEIIQPNDLIVTPLVFDDNTNSSLMAMLPDLGNGMGNGDDGSESGNLIFPDTALDTFLFATKDVSTDNQLVLTIGGFTGSETILSVRGVASTAAGNNSNRLGIAGAGGALGKEITDTYNAAFGEAGYDPNIELLNPSLNGTDLIITFEATGTAGTNNFGLINAIEIIYNE